MFMTKSSVLIIGEIENNRVNVDDGILWTWPECDVGFGFGWRSQEDWFYILLELSIWIFIHIIVTLANVIIIIIINAIIVLILFPTILYHHHHHYDGVSVCLCVTKNDHFLLGVSCNHLNYP